MASIIKFNSLQTPIEIEPFDRKFNQWAFFPCLNNDGYFNFGCVLFSGIYIYMYIWYNECVLFSGIYISTCDIMKWQSENYSHLHHLGWTYK